MGEVNISIREQLDVFVARWTVQRLAASSGFAPSVCGELAIVVSELATNILKYGVRGHISMHCVHDPVFGTAIELIAEDEGPPLADFALAVQDGFGDRGPLDPGRQRGRGGIGAGLGAVLRMTDVFEYRAGVRKTFRAVRYLRRRSPSSS